MTGITILLAVLAGVTSFASPCCLPLVPVYVSYMIGSAQPDLPEAEDAPASSTSSTSSTASTASAARAASTASAARRVAFRQSLVFVLGFAVVFVALWASVGLIGYVLRDYAGLLRILGGTALIVMGLHVARLIEISALYRTVRVPVGAGARGPMTPGPNPATVAPSYPRSALLGVAFAAGWTPCVGPILGGIIGLASVGDSVASGAALLVAYTLGLGIPFVLVAIGATEVQRRFSWFRRHDTGVSLVTGAILVLVGFLMITNLFARLSGLLPSFGL